MNIETVPNVGAMVAVRDGLYGGRVGTVTNTFGRLVRVRFRIDGAEIPFDVSEIEEIEAL